MNDHEAKLTLLIIADPPSNKLPYFYQRFCLRDLHKQHFVTCLSCSKGTSCGIILIFSRRNACTPPYLNKNENYGR
ncbi:Nuclear rim protein [Trichinella spiralis]|uniref:Nuclear rim protein n=1 Tax=Trichinella spiralis TaxID=6334 RepID=A0ABR3K7J1_TRISP